MERRQSRRPSGFGHRAHRWAGTGHNQRGEHRHGRPGTADVVGEAEVGRGRADHIRQDPRRVDPLHAGGVRPATQGSHVRDAAQHGGALVALDRPDPAAGGRYRGAQPPPGHHPRLGPDRRLRRVGTLCGHRRSDVLRRQPAGGGSIARGSVHCGQYDAALPDRVAADTGRRLDRIHHRRAARWPERAGRVAASRDQPRSRRRRRRAATGGHVGVRHGPCPRCGVPPGPGHPGAPRGCGVHRRGTTRGARCALGQPVRGGAVGSV